MADWLVDISTDPRRYPVVHHRHVNGTLRAERDRTPSVTLDHDGRRVERWTYACACGEIYTWDRRSAARTGSEPPEPSGPPTRAPQAPRGGAGSS